MERCDELLAFVDRKSAARPKRIFSRQRNAFSGSKERLEKLYIKLMTLLGRYKQYAGEFAPRTTKILNSFIYKYGRAYRKHMFLRRARHAYSLVKKLSIERLQPLLKLLASGLHDSTFEHSPTDDTIQHVYAVLIQRILLLDKLRIICAKNIDFSMGYLERRHNVNLNLLLIAIAAEFGSVALEQLRLLLKSYNDLAPSLSTLTSVAAPNITALPIRSVRLNKQCEIVGHSSANTEYYMEPLLSVLREDEKQEEKEKDLDAITSKQIRVILRSRMNALDDEMKREKHAEKAFKYREIPIKGSKRKRKNR